jgi:hypothetical protein
MACAVGKAQQVNNHNSIVCKTCEVGNCALVSASITCQLCSTLCEARRILIPIPVSTVSVFSLRVSSIPVLGSSTVGNLPSFFASGGYYNNAFLSFSKTTSTTGFQYISSGGSVSFTNGEQAAADEAKKLVDASALAAERLVDATKEVVVILDIL